MATEEPRDEAFHLAGERLGKFVVLSELGRGSMGVVYEAFQEDLKRKVALKVLPANISLDVKQVRRFHREAESVARLRHDNVIQIYEVGAIGNTHYFSMELVEGQPFGAFRGRDRETIRDAARMARDAARGLAHAHERGVVHRDVKPGNLLVDRDGRVVVTDFGLARLTESASLTSTDAIVGTPKYMSPEQILPGTYPLDGRTDLYSLGATLYEVLAGRPPIEEPSVQAFLRAILEKRPPSPRRFNRLVPHDLATIVLRCLEKDPGDRYKDALALADDLDRFLAGERIAMRPRGAAARAYETVRRHRILFALGAAAAVALVLVLFLGGELSQEQEERQFERRIALVEKFGDLDEAFERARELERRHPGDARVQALLLRLHQRRAEAELAKEIGEVDFDRAIAELELGGERGGFWHVMSLLERGRLDTARSLVEGLPENDPLRRLALGRVALLTGSFQDALDALAVLPPDDADLALACLHRLALGLAHIEVGGQRPPAEAVGHYLEAKKVLQDGIRRSIPLQQPWLRTLLQGTGYQAQQLLGETPDPRDLIPNLALVERTIGGLARLVQGMSVAEAESAQAYLDRVVALAGTRRKPPGALGDEAKERLAAAGDDPRARGLGNLLLAAARFSGGDLPAAAEAIDAADEVGAEGLHAWVYWGRSLVLRWQDRLAEAIDYALVALDYAPGDFPDLEPLARHLTLLVEEGARRGLAAPVARARTGLEERLAAAKADGWASEIRERIRSSASVPAPPR